MVELRNSLEGIWEGFERYKNMSTVGYVTRRIGYDKGEFYLGMDNRDKEIYLIAKLKEELKKKPNGTKEGIFSNEPALYKQVDIPRTVEKILEEYDQKIDCLGFEEALFQTFNENV